jgi:hypothetical protein
MAAVWKGRAAQQVIFGHGEMSAAHHSRHDKDSSSVEKK